jgi:hypothetical protein
MTTVARDDRLTGTARQGGVKTPTLKTPDRLIRISYFYAKFQELFFSADMLTLGHGSSG